MNEIEKLFDVIGNDYEAFRNLAMFVLTGFVNRGILALNWDIETQTFVFTVNDYEPFEDEPEIEIDPDEILAKMVNRKKKKSG